MCFTEQAWMMGEQLSTARLTPNGIFKSPCLGLCVCIQFPHISQCKAKILWWRKPQMPQQRNENKTHLKKCLEAAKTQSLKGNRKRNHTYQRRKIKAIPEKNECLFWSLVVVPTTEGKSKVRSGMAAVWESL